MVFLFFNSVAYAQDETIPPPPTDGSTGEIAPMFSDPTEAVLKATGLKIIEKINVETAPPLALPKPENLGSPNYDFIDSCGFAFWSPHHKYCVRVEDFFNEKGHLNNSTASYSNDKNELWNSGDWDGGRDYGYCRDGYSPPPLFFEDSGEVLINHKIFLSGTGNPIFFSVAALFNDDYSKTAYLHEDYSAISFLDLKTHAESKVPANYDTELMSISQKGDFVLVLQIKTRMLERINKDGTVAWSFPIWQFSKNRIDSDLFSIVNNDTQLMFHSCFEKDVAYYDASTGKPLFKVPMPKLIFKDERFPNPVYVRASRAGNLLIGSTWGIVDPSEAVTSIEREDTPTPGPSKVPGQLHGVKKKITRFPSPDPVQVAYPEILVFNLAGKILWHQRRLDMPGKLPDLLWTTPDRFYLTTLFDDFKPGYIIKVLP